MRFLADLHVHSRFSRATSAEMTPEGLWRWAQLKGISVVGTGDFTHPAWLAELEEKLVPAGDGLFALKEGYRRQGIPESCRAEVYFMLQAEISSIYRKAGRTRKVHSILLVPGFRAAREINRRLSAVGNLSSDGRPILGLDARRLLEIALEASGEAMLIPAHAWTPHFSVFGAASGFDSLEECFEDLSPHIRAIETGLSSDPPMNRRLSALDGLTLVSNSDAHSPSRLGREANVLDAEMSYPAVARAIRTGEGFSGTVEFFPEEGKYHLDGHRACGVSMHPEETRLSGFVCPLCGRRLTVGVMHRVEELADRAEPGPSEFRRLIPLVEVIGGTLGRGPATKGVQRVYFSLLEALGPEFTVLTEAPLAGIAAAAGEEIAGAVSRMRSGDVGITPGYDGRYGEIRIAGDAPPAPRRKKPGPAGSPGGRGRLF